MAVESDSTQCATAATDQGTATRKEFAVDHSIDAYDSNASKRMPQIDQHVHCTIVSNRKNILRFHDREQIENLSVSVKQKHVDICMRIPLLQPTKHRFGQHKTSEFTQKDYKNAMRRWLQRRSLLKEVPDRMPDRENSAARNAKPTVNPFLNLNVQGACRRSLSSLVRGPGVDM